MGVKIKGPSETGCTLVFFIEGTVKADVDEIVKQIENLSRISFSRTSVEEDQDFHDQKLRASTALVTLRKLLHAYFRSFPKHLYTLYSSILREQTV